MPEYLLLSYEWTESFEESWAEFKEAIIDEGEPKASEKAEQNVQLPKAVPAKVAPKAVPEQVAPKAVPAKPAAEPEAQAQEPREQTKPMSAKAKASAARAATAAAAAATAAAAAAAAGQQPQKQNLAELLKNANRTKTVWQNATTTIAQLMANIESKPEWKWWRGTPNLSTLESEHLAIKASAKIYKYLKVEELSVSFYFVFKNVLLKSKL